MRTTLTALTVFLAATPAYAWSSVSIPEPTNMALFGLGLAGLVIGRFASRVRR